MIYKRISFAWLFIVLCTVIGMAQVTPHNHTIKWKDIGFTLPISVQTISTPAIGKMEFGKTISGNKDWLKQLTIEFKNESDHPIVGVQFYMLTYNIPGLKLPLTTLVQYGETHGERSSSPAIVQPGQTAKAVLEDYQYNNLLTYLENAKAGLSTSLPSVSIIVREVTYSDNTYWLGGRILPDNPSPEQMATVREVDPNAQPAIGLCTNIVSTTMVVCCKTKTCTDTVYKSVDDGQRGPDYICNTYFPCQCNASRQCATDFVIGCGGDCGE